MKVNIKEQIQAYLEETRGINLVVVDIQPAYESVIHFLPKFIDFLNSNDFHRVLYLYNGEDFGMESARDIQSWLVENGLNEDKLNDFKFYEKNYAFFRGWMDTGVDHDDIITVGRYMIEHDVNDSRDIDVDQFNTTGLKLNTDIEELASNGDNIYIPDVVSEIQLLLRPLLCGGGRDECLAEVEMIFKMLNKRYWKHDKFIY